MVNNIKSLFSKNNIKTTIKSFLLTLAGAILLAFGTGVFLVPFSIVNGGISGISILISSAGFLTVDIWSYIFMWGLFILGVIFLGPRFSLSTLISTIFYPIFLSIILRTNLGEWFVSLLIVDGMSIDASSGNILASNLELMGVGRLLIIGLIGGALVGVGCGITFNGGGSTGGLDVLVFIINKYTNMKTSLLSFLCDAIVVLAGIVISLVSRDGDALYRGLIGIMSAFACSAMIEVTYTATGGGLVIDINTTKYKEINDYIITKLDKTTTIYDVIGGYTKINKKVISVAISTREFVKVRDEIAEIDPNAFLICYQAKQVNGLGWSPLVSTKENTIKMIEEGFKKKSKKLTKKVDKDNGDKPNA